MSYNFDLSILEHIYANEKKHPNKLWFTQPYTGGVVKETTWGQAMQEARKMATYLKSFDFEPGSKIGMISKNCDKFIIAEIAIWMAGYTTVAIFPNTNEKTVRYCLEQSESKFLFVGKLDGYDGLAPGFPEDIPKVVMPLAPQAALDNSSFKPWDEVISECEPLQEDVIRGEDDLALFIYTSGSTGTPKGVMHAFGPIKKAITGIVQTNSKFMDSNTRALSYLPLAHVFERCYVECVSFVIASHIFFAESLTTFKDDLQRCRPTVFISVPRLWLKFQQGVFNKFPEPTLNKLFSIPILSSIIKGKILKTLGLNKVKLAGSGSAAIPAAVLSWYRRLGLNLYEGYAMSEDFAYSHLSKKGYSRVGYVGVPYPGVKVKIDPDTDEILIDSPGKMVGYYKMEEKTADSFTADGYFKTGDRGKREDNGLLKITGRLKELFKTSKGKYISPAPIENVINANALIENSLVGGADQPQPYAQIVIAEELRKKMDDGLKEELSPKLEALLKEVNSGLEHHEHMSFFVVTADEWTTENGCLTPTLKIKRSAIEDLAAPKVDGWYTQAADGQKVIWD